MEVFCVKNRGYKWTEHDGSYFRATFSFMTRLIPCCVNVRP